MSNIFAGSKQEKEGNKTWWHVLIALMIVIGACKRLAAKAVFNLGLKDPDFMTCSAFFSMSLSLSLQTCKPTLLRPHCIDAKVKEVDALSAFFLSLIPSFLNFLGVAINFYALLVLPASIVSIIHAGAELLSVALLRRFFLNIRVGLSEWLACFLVSGGLIVVGGGHLYFSPISLEASSLLGMLIMIVRTVIGAGKTTIEEILFQRYRVPVHFVVGFEGISSFIFSFVFWLLKNPSGFYDAMSQLHTLDMLIAWSTFICVVGTTEVLAGCVTAYSSALTFCVFKSLRPFVLWGLSLFEYYFISYELGESWSLASWFQLFGFFLVSSGIWAYRISVEMGPSVQLQPLIYSPKTSNAISRRFFHSFSPGHKSISSSYSVTPCTPWADACPKRNRSRPDYTYEEEI